MDSDSISIIETWGNSKVTSVRVGICPVEIMPSLDGIYLYVVCSYLGCDRNGMVSVISTINHSVVKSIEVGMLPLKMDISPDGLSLYVTNGLSDNLSIIDLKRLAAAGRIDTGKMPHGVAVGENGLLFISNSDENSISIADINRGRVIESMEAGKEPSSLLYISSIIH
jgi:YVTN family beta-propeller protein